MDKLTPELIALLGAVIVVTQALARILEKVFTKNSELVTSELRRALERIERRLDQIVSKLP